MSRKNTGKIVRDPFPPVPGVPGSLRGPGACPSIPPSPARMDAPEGPICGCGLPSRYEGGWCGACIFPDVNAPLYPAAAALCMSEADFAASALALMTPAAYLRLLHNAAPGKWRERILAILSATDGNFSQAAERIGMTYRGLLKAVAGDAELQRAIAERWPDRHERGTFR